MSSEVESPSPPTSQPTTTISPTTRIKDLNAIDADISKVLATASRAIALLANNNNDTDHSPTLESIQEAFNQESKNYFASIASIDVRLRRQVHALEEAGLIPAGSRVDRSLATAMTEDGQTSRRGGVSPLDSSWLNARAKNTIGTGLKEEALRDGKEFLRRNGVGIQAGGEHETNLKNEDMADNGDVDEDEDMFGTDDT